MDMLKYITLDKTASTNTTAAAMTADQAPHGTVVRALAQTAGRGQRGNHWLSEDGKNLLFSMVLRPQHWPVRHQFVLSMAVSVGLCRALRRALPGHDVRIKWPNDIYVGNGKLVGILIENTLDGADIARSIAGIGINVNQTTFGPGAPNPVSMAQLTGRQYALQPLLEDICNDILTLIDNLSPAVAACGDTLPSAADALRRAYHAMLWRHDGQPHRWLDTTTLRMIDAAIVAVAPDGTLTMRLADGTQRRYRFKEIAAVL